ncbi:MAG: phosphoribosylformylglycinamidine synthase subunit PurL [Deltaproteobacteria bacterium]|nr:phosphoribosylformylglycinamidine synthase subunit PurL [Deltaproteobacteria bacterium]
MSTLTKDEHQRVVKAIGREPNAIESGIFTVMWSEHCCYKSSKRYLKQFPTTGSRVLLGPGENAGILDIGDGIAIAFKIESHNHPSFIEPYQGAATGVGGILRDIFTMGARPVALMDSLHFGERSHPRTQYLLDGVVSGIGGYGNCMGIPTIGGETHFQECYNGNILVNAFALGVMRSNKIFKGIAKGVGNPVILVGSKTGRDGIHGASMASGAFDADSQSKRPTVQVGDPFTEKKLMEACLEAFQIEGAIIGIQDMGAAGFTCSSFEMSARADTGMVLHLDKIPLRETGMTPYEIMLSESQERMLLVAPKGREAELKKVFEKWELEFAVVGEVIAEKKVQGFFNGEKVFELPVKPVTDEAPIYERAVASPQNGRGLSPLGPIPPMLHPRTYQDDEKFIWSQYDHMVGANTIVGPGADAAVIRIRENGALIAMTVDSKARWCFADPYWGAVHTVAEAARNLSCVGALPIGVTDCLNFGNPENPEIMWELAECCRGLAEACRRFETPVTGGNVSLYNETEGKSIWPTPVVAMVGLLPVGVNPVTSEFKEDGDLIYKIGLVTGDQGLEKTIPPLDWDLELKVQTFCREAIAKGLLQSAHDDPEIPSQIVVSLKPENETKFVALAHTNQCPLTKKGVVVPGTKY